PLSEGAPHEPKLTDNLGRVYRRAAYGAGVEVSGVAGSRELTPNKLVKDLLIFEPLPLDGVEFLHLELPASALGGAGTLRLQIPRAMIQTSTGKSKSS